MHLELPYLRRQLTTLDPLSTKAKEAFIHSVSKGCGEAVRECIGSYAAATR